MKLVTIAQDNTFATTTAIIAKHLTNQPNTHQKVNIALEKMINEIIEVPEFGVSDKHYTFGGNAFLSAVRVQKGSKLIENHVYREITTKSGDIYKLGVYRNDNNRLFLTWSLNERACIKTLMRLSKYKNALLVQDKITTAFFTMRDIIKNQQPHENLQKNIDSGNFGELSKVVNNNCGRVIEVRGYYRSSKKDDLSVLMGKRKLLVKQLDNLEDTLKRDTLQSIKNIDETVSSLSLTKIQYDELQNLTTKEIKK